MDAPDSDVRTADQLRRLIAATGARLAGRDTDTGIDVDVLRAELAAIAPGSGGDAAFGASVIPDLARRAWRRLPPGIRTRVRTQARAVRNRLRARGVG